MGLNNDLENDLTSNKLNNDLANDLLVITSDSSYFDKFVDKLNIIVCLLYFWHNNM